MQELDIYPITFDLQFWKYLSRIGDTKNSAREKPQTKPHKKESNLILPLIVTIISVWLHRWDQKLSDLVSPNTSYN